MNKKRLLSLILAALICLTILPLSVFALSEDELDIIWLEDKGYEVSDFHEGLGRIGLNGKYGFMDKNLKIVIPFTYDDTGYFSNGLAPVKRGDNWGYVDKSGKEVIPCTYPSAYNFSEGLALVAKDGMYGYIDTSGRVAIPFIYGGALEFSEGLAAVSTDYWGDGEWGFINKNGEMVIPFIYDEAFSFSDGVAKVFYGDNGFFVDANCNVLFGFPRSPYYEVSFFSEGLAAVQYNGWYGYINKSGEFAIPAIYQGAKTFSGGLALVAKDFKGMFINTKGETVLPFKYDVAYTFGEGLSPVAIGETEESERWGLIDTNGNEILPLIYDRVYPFYDGVTYIVKDGRWGLLSNPLSSKPKPPATPDPTAGASNWAVPIIKEAIDTGIVPKNLQKNYTSSVTRAEVAEMFVKLIEAASGKSIDAFLAEKGKAINPAAFTDTSDRNVLACNALGIINGKGNNKFDPSGYLKRAEIAAVLYNMAKAMGINTKGYTHNFTDTQNHWCNDLLGWPVYAKIVIGKGNNRFDPEGQLTVEQTITICLNALKAIKQ